MTALALTAISIIAAIFAVICAVCAACFKENKNLRLLSFAFFAIFGLIAFVSPDVLPFVEEAGVVIAGLVSTGIVLYQKYKSANIEDTNETKNPLWDEAIDAEYFEKDEN